MQEKKGEHCNMVQLCITFSQFNTTPCLILVNVKLYNTEGMRGELTAVGQVGGTWKES